MSEYGLSIVEKAVPTKAKVEQNKLYDSLPRWYDNQKLLQPTDYAMLLKAFKSWVYICASKNSSTFARVPLKLYTTKQSPKQKFWYRTKELSKEQKAYLLGQSHIIDLACVRKAEDLLEVTEHPLLELIKHVNPFMNKFEMLELTNLYLELTGNAYWYVVKNTLGLPAEIWVMQPNRVKVVPSRKDWISGYVYTTPDGIDIPFTVDEVVHFRFPNPHSYYYGWSPLQAMANSYNINESYQAYEENLLKNNAVPSIALTAPKDSNISEEMYRRTIQRWNQTYGGVINTGKAAFLDAGFDVKTLGQTAKEMGYEKGRRWIMQEICAAYGVPLSKVSVENVNRSNAESGDYQYMADTIAPRCGRFEDKLNESLLPLVDESLFIAFEDPVPKNKEFDLKERQTHISIQLTTINEERAKLGLKDVEWGDKPLVGTGIHTLGEEAPGMAGGLPVPGQQGQQVGPGQGTKPGASQTEQNGEQGGGANPNEVDNPHDTKAGTVLGGQQDNGTKSLQEIEDYLSNEVANVIFLARHRAQGNG